MRRSSLMMTSALVVAAVAAGEVRAQEEDLPSRERMWDIIQQQQERIDQLEGEQQETEAKVEATGDMVQNVAEEARKGPSGWFENTQIGGYGEVHFTGDTSLEGGEGGEAGGSGEANATAKRFVLEVGHQFNENMRFFSELEVENALIFGGEDSEGEVELEQLWAAYDIAERHEVRGGVELIPVGVINETHEPNTFFGTQRPIVERRIIPTTWWEASASLRGQLGNGFSYDAMIHTGLDASLEGAEGGEGGEVVANNAFNAGASTQSAANATAESGAGTLRLQWSGMPGVTLSATGQYQEDVTQDENDVEATLFETHADIERGPWGFRAMYARWDFYGDTSRDFTNDAGDVIASTSVEGLGRDQQWGWYVQPSYTFQNVGPGELGLFGRVSMIDDQAGQDSIDSRFTEFNFGTNYWLDPNLVVKANYAHQTFEDERDDEGSFNLALGLQF